MTGARAAICSTITGAFSGPMPSTACMARASASRTASIVPKCRAIRREMLRPVPRTPSAHTTRLSGRAFAAAICSASFAARLALPEAVVSCSRDRVNRSATSATSPESTRALTYVRPSPSMSSISRPAAYSMRAGRAQAAPCAQRQRSCDLLISPPQLGHASGRGTSVAPAGRSGTTAAWTRGMMSPAL